MATKSKPVEIIDIDTDTVEKDDAFPDAYAFYIQLSDEPDPVWERYLAKWENALSHKKRGIRVEGDRLRLVFTYGANIQSYAKYVAHLVKITNQRVEEHNKQVESDEIKGMTEQETDRKKGDEIRKQLRQLAPEPMLAEIEVTVEELVLAYETDEETADARFDKMRLFSAPMLLNTIHTIRISLRFACISIVPNLFNLKGINDSD